MAKDRSSLSGWRKVLVGIGLPAVLAGTPGCPSSLEEVIKEEPTEAEFTLREKRRSDWPADAPEARPVLDFQQQKYSPNGLYAVYWGYEPKKFNQDRTPVPTPINLRNTDSEQNICISDMISKLYPGEVMRFDPDIEFLGSEMFALYKKPWGDEPGRYFVVNTNTAKITEIATGDGDGETLEWDGKKLKYQLFNEETKKFEDRYWKLPTEQTENQSSRPTINRGMIYNKPNRFAHNNGTKPITPRMPHYRRA